MACADSTCGQRPRSGPGFTLVELAFTLLIGSILAAAAISSYRLQAVKARRADAVSMLAFVDIAQERHRTLRGHYAENPAALGVAEVSPGGHYRLLLGGGDAQGHLAVALAQSGSPQVSDTACARLAIRRQGHRLIRQAGPADGPLEDDDAAGCWPR